jgi:hypothetical protein
MVSDYIFPTESTTCFKNLTLTPLTTFSTVSDFAENLELLQPSNPRRGATAWADEGVQPSIKLLLVKHSFYERWSGFPMRFQFDCGRRMSNSRVGFGSSPGT